MRTLTPQSLGDFLQEETAPVISLYLPLDRVNIDKNRLALKNARTHAATVLAENWPDVAIAEFDNTFNSALELLLQRGSLHSDAVGLLMTRENLYLRLFDHPVNEQVMVTTRAQLLPLIRSEQYALDFHLLMLSSEGMRLFENHGGVLIPVALPDDAPVDRVKTLSNDEGTPGRLNSIGKGDNAVFHGHHDQSSRTEIDTRRYFQIVDAYIADHYSNPQQQKLVIGALPQNIAVFRELSQNRWLSTELEIEINAAQADQNQIEAALEAPRDAHINRVHDELLKAIDDAKSGGRFLDLQSDILTALQQGAVSRLIVGTGARVRGIVDDTNTIVTTGEQAEHNNLLNDFADMALAQGGQVNLLPPEKLGTDVVALLRHPL